MAYGVSDGRVTDDVMTLKGQTRHPVRLEPGFRDSVPKDYQWEMAYGVYLMVTWQMTSRDPQKYCVLHLWTKLPCGLVTFYVTRPENKVHLCYTLQTPEPTR